MMPSFELYIKKLTGYNVYFTTVQLKSVSQVNEFDINRLLSLILISLGFWLKNQSCIIFLDFPQIFLKLNNQNHRNSLHTTNETKIIKSDRKANFDRISIYKKNTATNLKTYTMIERSRSKATIKYFHQ